MQIKLNDDDLRPLVQTVVREVLTELGNGELKPLLDEADAAALFAVETHVLRDARKRGELQYHRVGRFVRYDREQLQAWKERTRKNATDA